jgi:hypothetical protein
MMRLIFLLAAGYVVYRVVQESSAPAPARVRSRPAARTRRPAASADAPSGDS